MTDDRRRAPSPERRALAAARLRAEAAPVMRAEPIAIIGLGCRFPGGGDGPEGYWALLAGGVDAITEVPAARWDLDAWYAPGAPGKMSSRHGAFLRDIDQFDAGFFGISAREAASMDPQQRLALEVSVEAVEDAGLVGLAGSLTGVYLGVSAVDYGQLVFADPSRYDVYTGMGSAANLVAGRVAYALDLHGPCLVVDTACSSSLLAVHLAAQALRAGECDLALAGGVNVILRPENTVYMSMAGMMAADGRCKSFDAAADGFVRGEGAGVIVLKRLADALRDGDRVRAVIAGSAASQDGRTAALTAPNLAAQRAVVRAALASAGLEPSRVGLVECHGTGTALGDPVEIEALSGALAGARRCALGAVKTNLGHLEAAAGVAGLIKAALAMQHERIPPNLHFQRLNPHIHLDEDQFFVPTRLEPWPAGGRVAGISSFGWSGTNVHVVLEDISPSPQKQSEFKDVLLPISAPSRAALAALIPRWQAQLRRGEETAADLAWTACARRAAEPWRLAVVGDTPAALLAALARAPLPDRAAGRPRRIFVFGGQGSQTPGMAAALLDLEPAFREAVEAAAAALAPHLGWSVLARLRDPDPARFSEDMAVVQPLLFAIQIGLAALWRALGVEPDGVIGHSMGEVAAAVVAGALSLEQGAEVIARRSALLHQVAGQGAMLSVGLSAAEAARRFAGEEHRVCVAVSNSPRSTALAGDPEALERIAASLEAQNIWCRRIQVVVAAHSPAVDPLLPALRAALAPLRPAAPRVPLWSSVTGARLDGAAMDAEYWAKNLRQTVRFEEAVAAVGAEPEGVFLELGPHPLLCQPIEQTLADRGRAGVAVPALRRDLPDRAALLEAAGALFCAGVPVDLRRLNPRGRVVSLPRRAWIRQRYWVEDRATRPGAWERALSLAAMPWLGDHRLHGRVVAPAALLLLLSFEAFGADRDARLEGFALEEPLLLPDQGAVTLRVEISGEQLSLWAGGRRLATGRIRALPLEATPLWPAPGPDWREADPAALYRAAAAAGYDFGPEFRRMERLLVGDGAAQGQIGPGGAAAARLDAALQVLGAAGGADDQLWAPLSIDAVCFRAGGARFETVQARAEATPTLRRGDLRLLDGDGRVTLALDGLCARPLAPATLALIGMRDAVSDTALQALPSPRPLPPAGPLLLTGDPALAAALVAALAQRGAGARFAPLEALIAAPAAAGEERWYLAPAIGDPVQVCDEARRLIQAAPGGGVRVGLLSRGAWSGAGEGRLALAMAALWGLGRSLAAELPERAAGLIDLEGDDLAGLADALLDADRPPEQLLSPGRRQRPQRRPAPLPTAVPRFSPEPAWLITGGLGGLGLATAVWLVERGARRITLAGRSPPSPAAEAQIAALRATGAEVAVRLADVGEPAALAALVAGSGPALRGVIHAAGALHDATLATLERAHLAGASHGKVEGAWRLHEATRHLDLTYFILYSSVAAQRGAAGQASHAAACAALDALALWRRRQGLPALSVRWGAWGEVGAAVRGGRDAAFWAARGARLMRPAEALAALGALLDSASPVLTISADQDQEAAAAAPSAPRAEGAPPLRQALQTAPAGDRRRLLGEAVAEAVRGVLRVDRALAADEGFAALGLDSLMSLELRRRLQQLTGLDLPPTLAFEHPTVVSLSAHLAGLLGLEAAAAPAPAPTPLDARAPVAIVGLAARLPGGIDSPEALWQALLAGVDGVGPVPADRWDAEALYDPDPEAEGRAYVKEGGFIPNIQKFDADFFRISPVEAAELDPQQRLLLELSWEALEDAGLPPDGLRGSQTGVYVGLSGSDFLQIRTRAGAEAGAYSGTGTAPSVAAGRVAYTFGLNGPVLAVDTACSSSLVALHLAAQDLRAGRASLALVAGVNAMLSPESTLGACRLRAIARDARCKSFDAAADGYIRSEGGVVAVLRPLADALAAGDRVIAVLRGSAVNHDGASSGLTVPSAAAQRAVIQAALADGGVPPDAVSLVETHGTGTAVGDPIEVRALLAALGAERATPLVLGALKSNLGHLEAAAGLAGLAKAALALHRKTIPPNLHFQRLNPLLEAEAAAVRVPVQAEPWTAARRVAGVSSFGLSGTNAHAVLEEAPPADPLLARDPPAGAWVLPISARSPAALEALKMRWIAWLRQPDRPPLADAVATAAARRAHHAFRAAAVGADAEALAESLASGALPPGPAGEAARRYRAGEAVDWASLLPARSAVVPLPAYPWQRERHWPAPARPSAPAAPAGLGPRQDLRRPPGAAVWPVRLRPQAPAWLVDHQVGGQIVAPGALFAALAAEAARDRNPGMAGEILDLCLEAPLVLGAAQEVALQISWWPGEAGAPPSLEIASQTDAGWTLHATATWAPAPPPAAERVDLAQLRARCAEDLDAPGYYVALAAAGVRYGPAFQQIQALWRREGEALAELRLDPAPLSPPRLDAALQVLGAAAPRATTAGPWVPRSLARLPAGPWPAGVRWVRAILTEADPAGVRGDLELLDAEGALLLRLSGLRAEPIAREEIPLFETAWVEAQPEPAAPGPQRWLLLRDRGGLAPAVAAELAAAGAEVSLIDGRAPPEALRARLGPGCTGVLCLTALDAPDLMNEALVTEASINEVKEITVGRLLDLAAALSEAGLRDPPRLVIATRRCQPALPEDAVSPAGALAWGLGRVIAAEHPELRALNVDLGEGAAGLAALLLEQGPEDRVALRGGRRLVARLRPAPGPGAAALRPSPTGLWLVGGGLGGLGLAAATDLVARGARRLLLVGRHADPAAPALAALRAAGAQVSTLAADLAEEDRLRAAVEAIEAEGFALEGVVHAAGVLHDGFLRRLDRAIAAAVLRPKLEGALALHHIACRPSVRAFLLYSSAASLLGSPGQGPYAAANAFLDALAWARRQRGLPALAVNWGPWATVGRAAGMGFEDRGFDPLQPPLATALLWRLAQGGPPQAAALAWRPRAWATLNPVAASSPFYAELWASQPRGAGDAALLGALQCADEAGRRALLLGLVKEQLGLALHLDPQRVDAARPLAELGMDSLLSLRLRNRLEAALGLRLSATLLWTAPTAAAVAEALLPLVAEQRGAPTAPAAPEAAPSAPEGDAALLAAILGEAAALSAEDLSRLLGEP